MVVLTMFAAETFDPRLMWDAAARREPAAMHVDPRLAAGNRWCAAAIEERERLG
jgi:hypothetical protein